MNSIDFRLLTVWRKESEDGPGVPVPRFQLQAANKTSLIPYDWITMSDEDYSRFTNDPRADERIIECVFDPSWVTYEYDQNASTWERVRPRPGGWKFERIREDKKIPNDIRQPSHSHPHPDPPNPTYPFPPSPTPPPNPTPPRHVSLPGRSNRLRSRLLTASVATSFCISSTFSRREG